MGIIENGGIDSELANPKSHTHLQLLTKCYFLGVRECFTFRTSHRSDQKLQKSMSCQRTGRQQKESTYPQQCIKIIAETIVNSRVVAHFNFIEN